MSSFCISLKATAVNLVPCVLIRRLGILCWDASSCLTPILTLGVFSVQLGEAFIYSRCTPFVIFGECKYFSLPVGYLFILLTEFLQNIFNFDKAPFIDVFLLWIMLSCHV